MAVMKAEELSTYDGWENDPDLYEEYRPYRANIVFSDGWPSGKEYWYSTACLKELYPEIKPPKRKPKRGNTEEKKETKNFDEMKELYKEAFVREPLMNNFENVTYEPQWGFPADTVESFQLCQMGNQFYSEDYIRASYAGVDFEIAEVRVYDVYSTDDRDERSTTYFEGRMMVFHLPDKAVYPMSIFSRKYKHRAISRREAKQTKVEFESSRFNKAYDVYAQNEHDAFYLITPQFMERLEILADKYADGIALHMIGNSVALAISEPGKNAFDAEIEVGKLDFDKEMAKVQGEIDDIKMLITMILNL